MALAEAFVTLGLDTSEVEDQLRDVFRDIEDTGGDAGEAFGEEFLDGAEQSFEDLVDSFEDAVDDLKDAIGDAELFEDLEDDADDVLDDLKDNFRDTMRDIERIVDRADVFDELDDDAKDAFEGLVDEARESLRDVERLFDRADLDLEVDANGAQAIAGARTILQQVSRTLDQADPTIDIDVDEDILEDVEDVFDDVEDLAEDAGEDTGERYSEGIVGSVDVSAISAKVSSALESAFSRIPGLGRFSANISTTFEEAGGTVGRVFATALGTRISDSFSPGAAPRKAFDSIWGSIKKAAGVAGEESGEAAGEGIERGLVGTLGKSGARAGIAKLFGAGGIVAAGIVAAFVAIGVASAAAFRSGFEGANAYLEVAESIDRNLLAIYGNAPQATAVLESFLDVAAETPFDAAEVGALGVQLAALAESLDTVDDTNVADVLGRIFDAAIFAGGGMAEATATVNALTKASLQGKVTLETYQQITEGLGTSGLKVADALIEAYGSQEAFNAALSNGEVSADQMIAAITGLEVTLDAASEQAKAFSGIMTNVAFAANQAFAQIALVETGFDDAFSELFDDDFIGDIASLRAEFAAIFAGFAAEFAPVLDPLLDIISDIGRSVSAVLTPAFRALGSLFRIVLSPALRLVAVGMQVFRVAAEGVGIAIDFIADALSRAADAVDNWIDDQIGEFVEDADELLKTMTGFSLSEFFGVFGDDAEDGMGRATDAAGETDDALATIEDTMRSLDGTAAELEIEVDDEALMQARDELIAIQNSALTDLEGEDLTITLARRLRFSDFDDGLTAAFDTYRGQTAAEIGLFLADVYQQVADAEKAVLDAPAGSIEKARAQLELEKLLDGLPDIEAVLEAQGWSAENIELIFNETFAGEDLNTILQNFYSVDELQLERELAEERRIINEKEAAFARDLARDRQTAQSTALADFQSSGTGFDAFLKPTFDSVPDEPLIARSVTDATIAAFGNVQTSSDDLKTSLDATNTALDTVFTKLPEGHEEVTATLLETTETFGEDLVEQQEAVASTVSETIEGGLTLDDAQQKAISSSYEDVAEDAGRDFVDQLADTVRAVGSAAAFEVAGLNRVADSALARLRLVESAARSLGVSGATIRNGDVHFNITVNGSASLGRTIDSQVENAGNYASGGSRYTPPGNSNSGRGERSYS